MTHLLTKIQTMSIIVPKPSKQHQLIFPQDARKVYKFPDTSGKLTNETRVQEMIDDSGGGSGFDYQKTRRNIIVSS